MSSLFCLLVAAVATSGAPAVGTAEAAEPDNPYDVEQLSQPSYLRVEKDADGNVRSVGYNSPAPPTDEQMARLKCLGHVRTLGLRTGRRDVYATLIRAWPTLRKAELTADEPNPEMMDALSALPGLEELELQESKLPAEVMKHLTGPATLRTLDLSRTTITDDGLAAIGRLKGLHVLDLSEDRVSDAGVRALAGLRELETLALRDTDVEGPGLAALKGLSHLRELDLRQTGVAEGSVADLRMIPGLHIQGLRTKKDMLTADDPGSYAALHAAGLFINRNDLGNIDHLGLRPGGGDPAEWTVYLKGLHSLKKLTLGHLATDAAMARLADAPSLQEVMVRPSAVTNAGLAVLPRLPNLRRFLLDGCRGVTDEGLAHIAQAKNLEGLGLADLAITGPGLHQLAGLKKLTTLCVSGSAITDAALASLAGMTQLEALQLDQTRITDAGLQHLRGMKRLRLLLARDTAVTEKALADLRRQIPGLRTQRGPLHPVWPFPLPPFGPPDWGPWPAPREP
jgi:hypothetical protein